MGTQKRQNKVDETRERLVRNRRRGGGGQGSWRRSRGDEASGRAVATRFSATTSRVGNNCLPVRPSAEEVNRIQVLKFECRLDFYLCRSIYNTTSAVLMNDCF